MEMKSNITTRCAIVKKKLINMDVRLHFLLYVGQNFLS
jgi:hypothetical protein